MKEDKYQWKPAPEIRPDGSDREILHALLDKLLEDPTENKICCDVANIEAENGIPVIKRRRFRLYAEAWVVKDNDL